MLNKFLFLLATIVISIKGIGQYAGQIGGTGSSTGSSYSQALIDNSVGGITDQYSKLKKQTGIDEFQGMPYLSEDFKPTQMYYNDELQGNIYYRYNAYNEEVEIKNSILPDEEPRSLNKDKSIVVMLDNEYPLSFSTFIDLKGNTINGYLALLEDGKNFKLFKRTRVKFSEGQKAQNSFVRAIPNRFTHYIEYYYQQNGVNRIDEIPAKNKKLIKVLDDTYKSKLSKYLDENDLNIKNEADLIKAFEFLNS